MNTFHHYTEEAARLEADMAYRALEKADREAARNHFHNILLRLMAGDEKVRKSPLLVTATLELSNLNFILGKGFKEAIPFLQASLEAAEYLGDRRSRAMIKLHLGRLYYFSDKRQDAMAAFEAGKAEAEQLGDDDIMAQSSEFIGLYYHIQGLFKQALSYFEMAVESFESAKGHVATNPSAPIWLGYCAAYLGQYHRAVGTLDYYRRISIERGDHALATTTRAVLGIVLLELGKIKEAGFHLFEAITYAEETRNALAIYFARGGIAYYYFLEGDMDACQKYLDFALRGGENAGLIRQYASPAFLEMGFELYKAGRSIYPDSVIQEESVRIMQEPNIHLRGVLLRLLAIQKMASGGDIQGAIKDLQASIDSLAVANTPVQLAKTRFELIRILLRQGDRRQARKLAQQAWKELAGYGGRFYPDDLRPLLPADKETDADQETGDGFHTRFIDIIQEIMPEPDPEALLTRLVKSTNRYFGAERGALFWFGDGLRQKTPVLRAACNLTETEVFGDDFRSNLALVFESHRENRLKMIRGDRKVSRPYKNKAVLCLPFEVGGEARGVLYHDNSYLPDCFNFLQEPQLNRLVHTLGNYIEHACGLSRDLEKLSDQTLVASEQSARTEIVGNSSALNKIFSQINQVAVTDSTIVILGETGVGKELIAGRIHDQSHRRDRPLVVIDPTTIPENLMESELFGHEKGAFTGADRQQKGRMEVAHKGTLFIDEVGEIPRSVQVKLLRAIQEKTFMRVGGTRTIFSDFRLIVATNRDLAQEVAAGRFREDLYYRLNVIPIIVPSLRERKKDILHLARYFLRRFAIRYNRPEFSLDAEQAAALLDYAWPGNIRELKNIIERGVLLSTEDRLTLDLPNTTGAAPGHRSPFSDMPTLDEVQRRYITHVLDETGGRIGGPEGAAAILGINRTTLYNRMKKLGLR
ncbi:MAG: sigma 54-interacting transcriptional regulator [Thermodesulfobacteriota bacterium]|nr:sigma 54-interacting transcriptional regulator [Thermodesulfobacteriota bacterium]